VDLIRFGVVAVVLMEWWDLTVVGSFIEKLHWRTDTDVQNHFSKQLERISISYYQGNRCIHLLEVWILRPMYQARGNSEAMFRRTFNNFVSRKIEIFSPTVINFVEAGKLVSPFFLKCSMVHLKGISDKL
jgi:hypothetical protein